jgi:peptide/nickel transport system substrate-binding protein
LHRDLPYLPLWFEDQVLATRQGIAGYRLAPDGDYDSLATVTRAASA